MVELTQVTDSQRKALVLAGVARSTWQYRHHPRPKVNDPIPHHERDYPTRVSAHDRERIEEFILAGWARDESVEHSFAAAWDQGVMLASVRTW